MNKLVEEMNWNEFYQRYTINHEEFKFIFNEMIINLCWGTNGTYSYNVYLNNKCIDRNEYASPSELLDKARFNGLKLKEIYNELD